MGYFLTSQPENAVPEKSWVPPKTHTPGSRLEKRGHRYYFPGLGRWQSRDPIEEEGFRLLDSSLNATIDIALTSDEGWLGAEDGYRFQNNAPQDHVDGIGLYSVKCAINHEATTCRPCNGDAFGTHQKKGDQYANGCGPIGFGGLFPDNPTGKAGCSFESVCNGHDCCYAGCNNPKADCDKTFYAGMKAVCTGSACGGKYGKAVEKKCLKWAQKYYAAILQGWAKWRYNSAQKSVCEDCCCTH